MTKMQVIAKTVLTSLGIYCIVQFCKPFTFLTFDLFDNCSFTVAMISVGISIVYVIFLLYFLILRNDWLAEKMAGSGERLSRENQILWLAASLRVGVAFCGIIMLANSTEFLAKILLMLRPSNLHQWVTRGANVLYDFLKVILAFYLLCGAPQFVGRQLKTAVRAAGINNRETHNPNLSKTNPKGTLNE